MYGNMQQTTEIDNQSSPVQSVDHNRIIKTEIFVTGNQEYLHRSWRDIAAGALLREKDAVQLRYVGIPGGIEKFLFICPQYLELRDCPALICRKHCVHLTRA